MVDTRRGRSRKLRRSLDSPNHPDTRGSPSTEEKPSDSEDITVGVRDIPNEEVLGSGVGVSTRFVESVSIPVDPGVDPRRWTGCIQIDCGPRQTSLQSPTSKEYIR